MYSLGKTIKQALSIMSVLAICASSIVARQAAGTLRGQVTDELGGVIVAATVTLVDANGAERTALTNEQGVFVFDNLAAGNYVVRVAASGFASSEDLKVEVAGGRRESLNVKLKVKIDAQKVTVITSSTNIDPDNNANAIVIRGAELDALPDDPDELASALQALAGPSAGPSGGQMYIDGFSGTRLPPKASIREVRINRNPYSAEFDRLGFGRIEVSTKPGTGKYHGGGFFIFNDETLNSRNAFAVNKPSFQQRLINSYLEGPIQTNRASFFLSFQRREINDNAIVNAVVLDPAFNIVPLNETVITPQRLTDFGPRFDYLIDKNNTLVAMYSYNRSKISNVGIGGFSLSSRAYDISSYEHTVRLSETAILGPRTVNEARFQYIRSRISQFSVSDLPALSVFEAFVGGGAQMGDAANTVDRWELHDYITRSLGQHTLRFGGRLRGVRIEDVSPSNFGGTYSFAGGLGPRLDANNRVVRDGSGNPEIIALTSIERYRRTLLFRQQGLSPSEIRALGGQPTQFSIAGGNPDTGISQLDVGVFAQDDWRMRPDFLVSVGMRYETQNRISSRLNFAPRIAFAWSPGATPQRQPKTVFRGGSGIFYDRFSENLSLQSLRYNGENQQQFNVLDPAVLDLFPAVPSVESLAAFAVRPTIFQVAEGLTAPYTIQSSISVERQLPYNSRLSVSYINSHMLHVLRSRNINAPLPGTFIPGTSQRGVRPLGDIGEVYEYESSGIFNQHQLVVTSTSRFNNNFLLLATYTLAKASSNTDGVGTFPANTYDLSGEYGRSSIDVRHKMTLLGRVTMPWGIMLNPLIIARSGTPFNITTGRDTNGDTLYTERPAFATDPTKPSVVVTRFGTFDLSPGPDQKLIPRNFGDGPRFFTMNLRVGKRFAFGQTTGGTPASPPQQAGAANIAQSGGQPGGRPAEKRLYLTIAGQALNVFNHTNRSQPIGNLSSSLFGRSNAPAGAGFMFGSINPPTSNRRIELYIGIDF